MAIRTKWTILIQSLRFGLRVGVHPHEQKYQPVQLSLKVSGLSEISPKEIEHCVDYEPLVRWLTEEFPTSPHTALLETRINEIARYVFSMDKRIMDIWVGLYKERAFPNIALIGIEREITRRQFDDIERMSIRAALAEPDKRKRKSPL